MSETEYSLGRNCGVTFAGIKPASMVCIKKHGLRDLERIARCFKNRGFSFCALKDNGERLLVFVYNDKSLYNVLFDKENKGFLESVGYRYSSVSEALSLLRERMKNEDFPHESGIFLGYPLPDVKGFISSPETGVKLSGYWKVYSDEKSAAEKFKRYKKCTECICEKMLKGVGLPAIFGVANPA